MKLKSFLMPLIFLLTFRLSSDIIPASGMDSDLNDVSFSKNVSDIPSEYNQLRKEADYSGGLKALLSSYEGNCKAEESSIGPDLADNKIVLRLLYNDSIVNISLHDYLIGVVAAEMPASFNFEALKAQAVASRSCSLYNMNVTRPSSHPKSDVCSNSGCCQAYKSTDVLKEQWGKDFDKYYEIISAAVELTDGLCLYYEDKLIYAPYHSSSDGATEDCCEVWSETPYLKSVASPESGDRIPNFISSVTVIRSDFEEAVRSHYNEELTGEIRISDISYTPSGRVQSIIAGGITIPGTELRRMFKLRSTKIVIEEHEDEIIFITYGWGHGVGMSQYGADELGNEGLQFDEILKWYYTGIDIAKY